MSSSRDNNGPRHPADEKKDRDGGRKASVLSDGPTQVRKVPGFGGEPDLEGALGIGLEDTVEVRTGGDADPRDSASAAGEVDAGGAGLSEPTLVAADAGAKAAGPGSPKKGPAVDEADLPSVMVTGQPVEYDENSFEGKLKKQGFTYIRPLGEGGMGKVYLASSDLLDELFVLKTMHAHLSDAATKERFLNEAKAARSVSHPNVIKVLIPFTIDGDVFLPMEFVEGDPLEKRLNEGLMEWGKAREVLGQICDGMQAIHDAGIVHRDLKPDNVILEKNNGHGEIAKIIDFGLAKKENVKRRHATIDGSVMGSPEYMSPEQATGKKVDARSDIYSFGAIFYQLLTGVPPFERDPEKNQSEAWMEIGLKIVHEQILPPIERAQDRPISRDVSEIAMMCLEKDPAKRPKSMAEVKARIMGATGYELPKPQAIALVHEAPDAQGSVPEVHTRPTDQSQPAVPPREEVALSSNVFASKSLIVDASAAEAAIAAADPEKTAIVRAPAVKDPQKGSPTIITSAAALKKSRRRLNRALIGGAAALGAAAAITAAVYFGSAKTAPARPAQPVATATLGQPLVDAGPATRPAIEADATPPIAPLVVNRTITFRTNVDGVEVLRGDESVCTTEGRTCSVQVQGGSDEVTFTFRRNGYRDAEMGVTPSEDQTVTVRLVAERTRPAGSNRPPHPPPHQADPLQNMVPNYNKKQ